MREALFGRSPPAQRCADQIVQRRPRLAAASRTASSPCTSNDRWPLAPLGKGAAVLRAVNQQAKQFMSDEHFKSGAGCCASRSRLLEHARSLLSTSCTENAGETGYPVPLIRASQSRRLPACACQRAYCFVITDFISRNQYRCENGDLGLCWYLRYFDIAQTLEKFCHRDAVSPYSPN